MNTLSVIATVLSLLLGYFFDVSIKENVITIKQIESQVLVVEKPKLVPDKIIITKEKVKIDLMVKLLPLKIRYDKHFKRYAKLYLPFRDWRWIKAQAYTESNMNSKAVSGVGARGLMQFMPGTWGDMEPALWNGTPSDVFNPELNIQAGAYYMSRLRKIWKSKRPEQDRWFLSLACYNAGCGNILKSQRLCKGSILYKDVMECLPKVTGRHAKETLNYIPRTERFYKRLIVE